jgi:hypothetical protein
VLFGEGREGIRTCVRISRLMFFCAVAGANSKRFALAVLTKYSKYLAFSNTDAGMKPTTLSGKHASKLNIPLSAMFAAIVMQSVPFGHLKL